MKKMIWIVCVCFGISSMLFAQELLVNGTFDNGLEGWTYNPLMNGAAEGEAEVIEDGVGPSAGSGPFLWVYGESHNVYINQCIWQPVTVMTGDTLEPDGAIMVLAQEDLFNYWIEIFLGSSEPVETEDYSDNVLLNLNTWAPCSIPLDLDGTFRENACNNNLADSTYWVVPDSLGPGEVTLYFMFKTGIWNSNYGDYYYELAVDNLSLVKRGGETGVKSEPAVQPAAFALYPNFPNPFNPSTTIRFTTDKLSEVILSIYDINGRLVRTLMRETLNAGTYSTQWEGSDSRGNSVPSGVYLYQLQSGGKTETQRMILLK